MDEGIGGGDSEGRTLKPANKDRIMELGIREKIIKNKQFL
ncbi:hypothetical protein OXPF_01100 [Oxobacter pfennigii]|uniref:Uncharacterized protein n=1 Tax=Oxobacter pfennigii TaxID=36849 RepID=A0A0P8WC12_9CLOT|nr:hypothetical protein OXPF_01100 [Oxobacter pfennigii]